MTPYVVAFAGAFRRHARARANVFHVSVFYAILLVAWGAIWFATTRAAGGEVKGYTFEMMFWYLAATEGAVVAQHSRRIETIGDEIVAGAIETEMLRPVSVVGMRLANDIGEAAARLLAIAVVGFALGVLYTHTILNPASLALAVPSMILAAGCNVAGVHIFAGLSFWIRDSKAGWFLFQKLIFLVGGMLLPLQMLPGWLAAIAWVLPFWAMAYAPGRLAAGFFEPLLLLGQIAWLGALVFLAHVVFTAGQRRVQTGVV